MICSLSGCSDGGVAPVYIEPVTTATGGASEDGDGSTNRDGDMSTNGDGDHTGDGDMPANGDGDGDGDGDMPNSSPVVIALLDAESPAPFCELTFGTQVGVAEGIMENPPVFNGYVHPVTGVIHYHTENHDDVMTLDGPAVDVCETTVSGFSMVPVTGELLFRCDGRSDWLDEAGNLFSDCSGHNYVERGGGVLCDLRWPSEGSTDFLYQVRTDPRVEGEVLILPEAISYVYSVISAPDDGWWMMAGEGGGYVRYHIATDGEATREMVYKRTFGQAAGIVGPDGLGYIAGYRDDLVDVIRRHTDTETVEVLEEYPGCEIRGARAYLFSTP